MEVMNLRVKIWETNEQFGNYVISRSYETIHIETKHLWGFVVARKVPQQLESNGSVLFSEYQEHVA